MVSVLVAKHLICLSILLLLTSPTMPQLSYPRKNNLTLSSFLLYSSEFSQTSPYHLVVVGFHCCRWTLKRKNLSGPSVDGQWPCGCYIYISDLVVYMLFINLADSFCLTSRMSSGPLREDIPLPSSLGAIVFYSHESFYNIFLCKIAGASIWQMQMRRGCICEL